MTPKVTVAPSARFDIFMAGDIQQARQMCRQFCFEIGLCVTVEAVDFIYTGGEETGFRVGLINYPRFPKPAEEIFQQARQLGDRLMEGLHQLSYSIVGPAETVWISRRPD